METSEHEKKGVQLCMRSVGPVQSSELRPEEGLAKLSGCGVTLAMHADRPHHMHHTDTHDASAVMKGRLMSVDMVDDSSHLAFSAACVCVQELPERVQKSMILPSQSAATTRAWSLGGMLGPQ